MIGRAGVSCTSSVSSLNARPSTAIREPASGLPRLSRTRSTVRPAWSLFTSSTWPSNGIGAPWRSPWATSAATPLGRQLPPNPQPGIRKEVIGASRILPSASTVEKYCERWSACITSATSTSPSAVQSEANSFENEINRASTLFELYLIISAVEGFVRRSAHRRNRRSSVSRRRSTVRRRRRARCGLAPGNRERLPSVRNSGFIPTPKSRSEHAARGRFELGRTTPSVVPGTTVLLTTTTW